MKYIFKKYEYPSQELAETRIAALPHQEDEDGNSHPSHNHTVVKLGNVVVEQGVYEEGEDGEIIEVTAPVLAENYSVDVLWHELEQQPEDWAPYEIVIEDNGVHTFFGINYV